MDFDVDIFLTCEDLYERLQSSMGYHLIFLDIEFPNMNGVDLGKKIRGRIGDIRTQIGFISAKDSYAMELFSVHPFDFIIKPVSKELGHHYDDVIETILMSMLYGGQIQTMMPKLNSTNFEGMQLIRPLYMVREDDIKRWRDYNGLRFIQCACKFTDTCTTCAPDSRTVSKRMEIKQLIAKLKLVNPQVEYNIFKSVENVMLNQVIAYKDDEGRHSFLERFKEE